MTDDVASSRGTGPDGDPAVSADAGVAAEGGHDADGHVHDANGTILEAPAAPEPTDAGLAELAVEAGGTRLVLRRPPPLPDVATRSPGAGTVSAGAAGDMT